LESILIDIEVLDEDPEIFFEARTENSSINYVNCKATKHSLTKYE